MTLRKPLLIAKPPRPAGISPGAGSPQLTEQACLAQVVGEEVGSPPIRCELQGG